MKKNKEIIEHIPQMIGALIIGAVIIFVAAHSPNGDDSNIQGKVLATTQTDTAPPVVPQAKSIDSTANIQVVPSTPKAVYLTREQIITTANQTKENIQSTISASPAQNEINQLKEKVQTLQNQEEIYKIAQINAQSAEYGGSEFGNGFTQDDVNAVGANYANLFRPQGEASLEGRLAGFNANISGKIQMNEYQIQEYNNAITADESSISKYKQQQYAQDKATCGLSNDISQADIDFCQSLWNL